MNVFVTGHQGYIGAHLVEILKKEGHSVTGCDLGLFEGCAWEKCTPPDCEIKKDIRNINAEDLAGHNCVMHLAALSNDSMGDINPSLTLSVNRDAAVRLAKLAKKIGITRFLFSGSCSVYGKGEKLDLEESDPLNPLTPYAQSKIDTEKILSTLADESFSPIFLRSATAYGHSPALRVDLVVNNLLASAYSYNEIRIMSDGSPWRPLIHCRDIARAFVAFMKAPQAVVHNKAVNIGGNDENYQVRDVAEQVSCLMPDAKIVFTDEVGADPRNYRVKFNLLSSLLPNFSLQYTLSHGMEELWQKMREHQFCAKDFESEQFVRLRTLSKRLHLLRSA